MRPLLCSLALLAPLAGCRPAPPALPPTPQLATTTPSGTPFSTPGPQVQDLRDALGEAEIHRPPPRRGAPPTPGRTVLAEGWTAHRPGVWVRDSPVRLRLQGLTQAPAGTQLTLGGQPLPYQPRLAASGTGPGWQVDKGRLYLATGSGAPTAADPPVFWSADVAAEAARRDPRGAHSLSPAAHARWRGTLADRTRACVLVPGGGAVQWQLDVPAGTALRLGLGIPDSYDRSTHGRAHATVHLDDSLLWEQTVESGQDWVDTQLALPPGAHSLRFAADPLGDPAGDSLCFAEPALVPAAEAPPASPARPRRVVLVGIDTLRVDRLGASGAVPSPTPVLDQLADQSATFDRTWAPAPRTRPSFRTLLTGRWPGRAPGPLLATQLHEAGFTTAGFSANVHLSAALGFPAGSGDWHFHDSDDAAAQVDRALAWLDGHAAEDAFLFLHLMDPHVFYRAPAPFWGALSDGPEASRVPARFNRWTIADDQRKGILTAAMKTEIQARYTEELRYLDHELGRFLQALDQLPGDTLLVVASDHGEEHWDHGGFEHNHALYDELTRALLWVRPPGGLGARVAVAAPTSLADVVPTVRGFVGLPALGPEATDGQDLGPLIPDVGSGTDGGPGAPGAAALERRLAARDLPLGHFMFGPEAWGVVHQGQKYVLHTSDGKEELYGLADDPGEQRNRAATLDDAARAAWVARLAAATGGRGGLGWRIHLRDARLPFTLHFADPVAGAGVIDPEAARVRRTNQEWGEVPPVLPDEVATVAVSDDGHTVTVRPGDRGVGVLWVLGPGRRSTATVDQAGRRFTVGVGRKALGGGPAVVAAGALLVETPAVTGAETTGIADETRAALQALGYLD